MLVAGPAVQRLDPDAQVHRPAAVPYEHVRPGAVCNIPASRHGESVIRGEFRKTALFRPNPAALGGHPPGSGGGVDRPRGGVGRGEGGGVGGPRSRRGNEGEGRGVGRDEHRGRGGRGRDTVQVGRKRRGHGLARVTVTRAAERVRRARPIGSGRRPPSPSLHRAFLPGGGRRWRWVRRRRGVGGARGGGSVGLPLQDLVLKPVVSGELPHDALRPVRVQQRVLHGQLHLHLSGSGG